MRDGRSCRLFRAMDQDYDEDLEVGDQEPVDQIEPDEDIGEVYLANAGWYVTDFGMEKPRAAYSLPKQLLRDPECLPRLLSKRFSDAQKVTDLFYAARYIHGVGNVDRPVEVEVSNWSKYVPESDSLKSPSDYIESPPCPKSKVCLDLESFQPLDAYDGGMRPSDATVDEALRQRAMERTAQRKAVLTRAPSGGPRERALQAVKDHWHKRTTSVLTPHDSFQLERLLDKFSPDAVIQAMDASVASYLSRGTEAAFSMIRAFLHIQLESIDISEAGDMHYVCGILRNRHGLIDQPRTLRWLRTAVYVHVPIATVRRAATTAQSYSSWLAEVQDLILLKQLNLISTN